MKIVNYENKDFLLFEAVGFNMTKSHLGRALSESEFEIVKEYQEKYSDYIDMAKEMLNKNPKYLLLDDYDRANVATWIVDYLRNLETVEDDSKQHVLPDKNTIRYLI